MSHPDKARIFVSLPLATFDRLCAAVPIRQRSAFCCDAITDALDLAEVGPAGAVPQPLPGAAE